VAWHRARPRSTVRAKALVNPSRSSTVRAVRHPPLIDLDTGDEYEWITDPAGGGEPGYAHVEDHDGAWPWPSGRVAEITSLDPEQVQALRARYLAGDADEEQ
jgi:hypothetical protein